MEIAGALFFTYTFSERVETSVNSEKTPVGHLGLVSAVFLVTLSAVLVTLSAVLVKAHDVRR